MLPLLVINSARIGLVLLLAAAGIDAKDALSPKPADENTTILQPMCLNPEKKDSGVDTTEACQRAIDDLYSHGSDNVAGVVGKCKQVAKAGECVVALCDADTDKAKLAKSVIATVAQGIHSFCKKGPKDGRHTGGSSYNAGLQANGEPALSATVFVGKMFAAPEKELKLRIRGQDRGQDLAVESPTENERSIVARVAGDTFDLGGGWRMRVLEWGRWQVSSATQGHLNIAGSMLVQNWNGAVQQNDPTTVTSSIDPSPDFRVTLEVRARNNHNIADIPQAFRENIRRQFVTAWVAEGRPGTFEMAIERTTDNESEIQTYDVYGYFAFVETRVPRPMGPLVGSYIVMGGSGVHYGGFV